MKSLIKKLLFMSFKNKMIAERIKNADNKIAITFDDGPSLGNNDRLLTILREKDAKASFFVSGAEIEKNKDSITKIKAGGHDLGNHGFTHQKISDIGFNEYFKGIDKTNALIEQYSSAKTSLFRPPYGELNFSLLRMILKKRLVFVGWTVDSNDSYTKDSGQLINNFRTIRLQSGDIILFHEDYPSTIEAMPGIIDIIKNRGFKLVTLTELIKAD